MGAGMSKEKINSRIRYRLQRTAHELNIKGVRTVYRKYEVFPDMTGDNRDIAFNISFNVSRASNGEVSGFPRVTIIENGVSTVYGWLQKAGTFEDGIARIVELWRKDFLLNNQGTIYILEPVTARASYWAKMRLTEDALRFGLGYVVEHRYIADIVNALRADGYVVFEVKQ